VGVPKRRLLRFSLRAMFVVVTALCIWLGIQVNAARRQREAVTAILKIGGEVLFDYQSVPPPPGEDVDLAVDLHAAPPGPEWLRSRIGDDYFRNVISVAIKGKIITESDLKQLSKLPKLKQVFINNTKIVPDGTPIVQSKATENEGRDNPFGTPPSPSTVNSVAGSTVGRRIRDDDLVAFESLNRLTALTINDAEIKGSGLKSVLNLSQLASLGLVNSRVEDAGLEQIGKMVNLKSLSLDGAKITDVGLKRLQELTNLESLALIDTDVTDMGPEHLSSKNVKLLMLRNTHVGDRTMEHIGKITTLEILFLDGTRITDAGLKSLQGLKHLKTLTLGNTNVTDAGLQYLKGLKKLETLPMDGTKVTREGVRELQKALPTTQISGP
jgi:Leucine-rich repeat (LRR) protein